MSDNPYESPSTPVPLAVLTATSGTRETLRRVALNQRKVLGCLLLHLVFVGLSGIGRITQWQIPTAVTYVGLLLTWYAGAILVFLLAKKVFSRQAAVLVGILASVPIFGLIVFLVVQTKANSILRQHGLEVGFWGADLSRV